MGAELGRALNKLTAVSIKAAAPGKLQDGGGLILNKAGNNGKWLFRYSIAGQRREMGLGAWPEVSLADARKARARWASVLAAGTDPISERARLLEAEREALNREEPTLAELVYQVFEAKRATYRNDGRQSRWLSPVKIHVLPKLGNRKASSINQIDIRDVLAPIWRTKQPTANMALLRLGMVFRHARLSGVLVDPVTVDIARHMLGQIYHIPTPIAATPWQQIPALFQQLGEQQLDSCRCLQWMILTAVRSDGCRGARFDEIKGDVWTVPASRVKGMRGKVSDFRVPLTDAALELVEICKHGQRNGYLFPGPLGRGISSCALQPPMNKLGQIGRPHGFRTSFRTWVQDTQAASYEVAETALGHVIGGRVERSYARSDLLEQRRTLMQRWCDYVTGAHTMAIS